LFDSQACAAIGALQVALHVTELHAREAASCVWAVAGCGAAQMAQSNTLSHAHQGQGLTQEQLKLWLDLMALR
jgi:hypothetical protein